IWDLKARWPPAPERGDHAPAALRTPPLLPDTPTDRSAGRRPHARPCPLPALVSGGQAADRRRDRRLPELLSADADRHPAAGGVGAGGGDGPDLGDPPHRRV